MFKKFAVIFILLGLVAWAVPVLAKPDIGARSGKFLRLPPLGGDRPNVIYLGKAVHPKSGEVVEGYAFIRYKDGAAVKGVQPPKPAKPVQCYSFLASGAKWKTIEPWVLDPTNQRSLDASFIFGNLAADISKWEDAADGKVDGRIVYNILGDGSFSASSLSADTVKPDGLNEVYFADISTSNAIAVTIIWGVFSGSVSRRYLAEWDMIFDDVDFDWSAIGESNKMDFEDIATHELGHAVGMNDLYNSVCNQETMYGYAAFGETLKRTLNSGDILGVSVLY